MSIYFSFSIKDKLKKIYVERIHTYFSSFQSLEFLFQKRKKNS